MSSEQAREVEVVARALGRAHGWTDDQLDARQNDVEPHGNRWLLWVDDAHSILAALEPIRAAERQEAAREALDRVGAEIDRLHFSGAPAEAMHLQVVHNAAIDLAVRSIEVAARQHDDRADGVTGRSET